MSRVNICMCLNFQTELEDYIFKLYDQNGNGSIEFEVILKMKNLDLKII